MSTTPNLGLLLYAAHASPWDSGTNGNWTLVDTFAATCIVKSPSAAQILTQPSATYFSVNGLQIFGTTPVIPFAVSAGNFSAALSMPSVGTLSVDSSAVGNGGGTLVATVINAKTGFQLNGAAPSGHFLVGDGTHYVDSASLPGALYYQNVESNSGAENQRAALNFTSGLTVTDNPGNNSTDVALSDTGVTPGAYTIVNATVGADGRLTAITNGTPSTYNPIAHDVTGSRVLSTVYQNTTGGTMRVYGYGTTTGSTVGSTEARIGPTNTLVITTDTIWATTEGATVDTGTLGFAFEVQNNWYYAVYANTFTNSMGSGVTGLGKWWEVY
jgi:hypothetical protein